MDTKKRLYTLEILPELQTLCPPLQESERSILLESILRDGILDTLKVWNGILIDGHNRYAIAHTYGIPFAVEEMDFEDLDEAKLWIGKHALGQRNMATIDKCLIALAMAPLLRAEARARQGQRSDLITNLPPGKGRVLHTMARLAGVSNGTMDKVRKIFESDDETLKAKVRSGDMSIHRAYTKLQSAKQAAKTPDRTPDHVPDSTRDSAPDHAPHSMPDSAPDREEQPVQELSDQTYSDMWRREHAREEDRYAHEEDEVPPVWQDMTAPYFILRTVDSLQSFRLEEPELELAPDSMPEQMQIPLPPQPPILVPPADSASQPAFAPQNIAAAAVHSVPAPPVQTSFMPVYEPDTVPNKHAASMPPVDRPVPNIPVPDAQPATDTAPDIPVPDAPPVTDTAPTTEPPSPRPVQHQVEHLAQNFLLQLRSVLQEMTGEDVDAILQILRLLGDEAVSTVLSRANRLPVEHHSY